METSNNLNATVLRCNRIRNAAIVFPILLAVWVAIVLYFENSSDTASGEWSIVLFPGIFIVINGILFMRSRRTFVPIGSICIVMWMGLVLGTSGAVSLMAGLVYWIGYTVMRIAIEEKVSEKLIEKIIFDEMDCRAAGQQTYWGQYGEAKLPKLVQFQLNRRRIESDLPSAIPMDSFKPK